MEDCCLWLVVEATQAIDGMVPGAGNALAGVLVGPADVDQHSASIDQALGFDGGDGR
jgi:hypothetical protein